MPVPLPYLLAFGKLPLEMMMGRLQLVGELSDQFLKMMAMPFRLFLGLLRQLFQRKKGSPSTQD